MNDHSESMFEIVVAAGLHAGARRGLRRNDMLLVGGSEACDVVLADAGVALRHCLVGIRDGVARIDAIDASLRVGGELLEAGAQANLQPGADLTLGEAVLRLVPVAGVAALPGGRRLPRWTPVGALAACAALLALALVIASGPPRPDAATTVDDTTIAPLRAIDGVEELALAHGEGAPRVVGRVRDAQARAKVVAALPAIQVDLVVGEQLAVDVRQALRGFDLLADARYRGAGVVEIVSAGRDQEAIKKAIGAERARGNLAGLSEVALMAADARPAAAAPPADDGKRIVAVVVGADPHARTADGSTYGVGARLPDGGLIVGVEGDALRVLYGDEVRIVGVDPASTARPLAMR